MKHDLIVALAVLLVLTLLFPCLLLIAVRFINKSKRFPGPQARKPLKPNDTTKKLNSHNSLRP